MTDKPNKLTDTLKRTLAYLQHRLWDRQRRADIKLLWPAIRKLAGDDIDSARQAFLLHASIDRAWLVLGEEKAIRIIWSLPL